MGVMNRTTQSPTTATVYTPKSNVPSGQLDEARRIYNEGKEEYQAGRYDAAVRLFVQAVQVQEVVLGKYHQETIKTYWRLGRAAAFSGQYQKSIEAFHRTARMADTTFDDLVVESVLSDVDSCWQRKDSSSNNNDNGDVGIEVSQYGEKNGDHGDKKPSSSPSPVEDLRQILVLEKQADLSCKKRDFHKAVESYQEALDLLSRWVGQDLTLDGADLNVKKATCDIRLSKTEEAVSALKAAYDCYLRQLGPNHPATLGAAANLTTVQRSGPADEVNNARKGNSGGWVSESLSSLVGSEGVKTSSGPVGDA